MSKSTGPLPPNTTLYVKNIPNKIKKPELKRQLYCLFVTYGKLLDVVATKVDGMRGQAFVVFQDLASSTAALRALDGFIFYEKPLVRDGWEKCTVTTRY
jgi:U2 small nuclear ribonucleoprotein B''